MPRKPGSRDKNPRKKRGGEKDKSEKKSSTKNAGGASASANGSTDNASATAERGAGHNIGGSDLTQEEQRALFLRGLVAIEGEIEIKDDAVKNIRTERKRLISYGFTSKQIDFGLRLRKNDEKEEVERRRQEALVAWFCNHPIGTQPDMFDAPMPAARPADHAYQRGKVDGIEGKGPLKPPSEYGPGTADYDDYCKGWHDGQAELVRAGMKVKEPEDASSSLIPANRPDAEPTRSNDDFGDALNDTAQGEAGEGEADFGLGAAAEGDRFLEEQRAKEST